MDTTWELEWLVPEKHSISGRPYWSRFEDGRFNSEDEAWEAWKIATAANESRVRLVKVSRDVVALAEPVTQGDN
jgi:hypothetical protein